MKTRAAIYARHSTDKQATSTQDQIDRCKAYCCQVGYEVTLVFSDEAVSGASIVNRPGIGEMIDAAMCDYFDKIVSEDLSRFSRDQGDIAHFYRKFRFMDIGVETVAEGEINELHIGLKGTMNALYLKDLADKTRRGMIAAVLKGSIPGGKTYGYDLIKKYDSKGEPIRGLREINPEQAETIRWIFEQYDAGATLKHLCNFLNKKGIPSPKGGEWVQTTLIGQADRKTGLLRQTLYKGVLTFNRMMYRKNPDTGRRLSFLRPESDWIMVPTPELAIVDEELFDRVQDKIEERSSLHRQRVLLNQVLAPEKQPSKIRKKAYMAEYHKKSRRPKSPRYIFSGKLWCGIHDTPIHILKRHTYNCDDKTCAQRYVALETLLPIAIEAVQHLTPDMVRSAIEDNLNWRDEIVGKIAIAEEKITALRDEIDRIFNMTTKPARNSRGAERLNEAETELIKARYELKLLQDELNPIDLMSDDEIDAVIVAYHKTIAPLRTDHVHEEATAAAKHWFARFTVTSEPIPGEKKLRTWSMSVTFDWFRLLKDLKASPAPTHTRPRIVDAGMSSPDHFSS